MDEHCAWQQNKLVNKLFGITAPAAEKRDFSVASGDIAVTDEGARWGLAAKDLMGLTPIEADIKAETGTPLLRIGNTDAIIVRRLGKGTTIYLNTILDQYPKLRATKFGGAAYRTLVNALLAGAGVRPAIQVLTADGHPITQAQIARYHFGDAEILAIVKDNVAVAGVVGQDGVTVYNDANLGQVAKQQITIKLPRKAYIADVRSGKQFGYTDVVQSSALLGDAVLLGLSPVENKITWRGPATASRGDHVSFILNSSIAGRRLIRCHLFAPDGALLPVYANNLLMENGSSTFVLPSALNDPPGVYTIRATDVVTGATAETKVNLK
jgi:hypothetical protein